MIEAADGRLASAATFLTESDGPAFEITNAAGQSPFILVCEHASNRMPEALRSLGLDGAQLQSHVAWDPGAYALAQALSASLDAPLLSGRFSRLVYDCNRPPESPSAIPDDTEVCGVPGNRNLSRDEQLARVNQIYDPFHRELARMLSAVRPNGLKPILIAVHSFTPVFNGEKRDVEVGLLHGTNKAFAETVRTAFHDLDSLDVRLNEPYGPKDGVLHTFERHIDPSINLHLMIEIRNDLISTVQQISRIKNTLASALTCALSGEAKARTKPSQGTS